MQSIEPIKINIKDKMVPIVHGITSWDNYGGDYHIWADTKVTMLFRYPCVHGNALEINLIEGNSIEFNTGELWKKLKI